MNRTRITPNTQYNGVAFLLGMVWCAALMVPETTRHLFLEDHGLASALLLCVVSSVVATAFKRPIAKARGGWRFAVLAFGLPFVGAALWFMSATLIGWLIGPRDAPIWNEVVVGVRVLPIALGVVAVSAYYVVIPMGILSQYIMHRLARSKGDNPHVHAAT